MYIPNSGEMVVFMAGLTGALIGFLWYNAYPAQVFMGDVGSLTLGGIVAVFALMIRVELLLVILCGVFLAESVSVIVQRLWYKYTRIRATRQLMARGQYKPGKRCREKGFSYGHPYTTIIYSTKGMWKVRYV